METLKKLIHRKSSKEDLTPPNQNITNPNQENTDESNNKKVYGANHSIMHSTKTQERLNQLDIMKSKMKRGSFNTRNNEKKLKSNNKRHSMAPDLKQLEIKRRNLLHAKKLEEKKEQAMNIAKVSQENKSKNNILNDKIEYEEKNNKVNNNTTSKKRRRKKKNNI